MSNCNSNNSNTSNHGYIYETIQKIDQMQKNANIQSACDSCEGSLVSYFYNTKPVSFQLKSGGKLVIDIPESTLTTTFFRIEGIKNDCVILRLLEFDTVSETFICTSYTVAFLIDCCCCIQCYQPICCPECYKCSGV